MTFAQTAPRIRRINREGYGYGESAPFYVWDGRLRNPCGRPVEGFAKLCRTLKANPHLFATGHQSQPAKPGPFA